MNFYTTIMTFDRVYGKRESKEVMKRKSTDETTLFIDLKIK